MCRKVHMGLCMVIVTVQAASSRTEDLFDMNASASGSVAAQDVSFDPWGTSTPSTSIPAAQQATPSSSNPFTSPNSSMFSSPPSTMPAASTSDPWGPSPGAQSTGESRAFCCCWQ